MHLPHPFLRFVIPIVALMAILGGAIALGDPSAPNRVNVAGLLPIVPQVAAEPQASQLPIETLQAADTAVAMQAAEAAALQAQVEAEAAEAAAQAEAEAAAAAKAAKAAKAALARRAPPAPPVAAPPVPSGDGSVDGAIAMYFGDVLSQAYKIATCESGLNPGAVSRTGDYGLFQINQSHKAMVAGMGFSWAQLFDPYVNAQVARALYDAAGWGPWACKRVL